MDEPGQDSEVVDPAAAAPLLDAVWGSDPELRNAALPALVRLSLSESTWQAIGRYADDMLSQHADRPRDDLLAVIEASPWIPSAATRRLAERVIVEALADDEDADALVLRCLDQLRRNAEAQPIPSTPDRGFAVCSDVDRERVRSSLSGLTDEQLWSLLDGEQSGDGDQMREALVVTHLMESAGRRIDLISRYRVMQWVADQGPRYLPDLDGLAGEFRRHVDRLPDVREELMARQVAWIISRGGLTALLEQAATATRVVRPDPPADRLPAGSLLGSICPRTTPSGRLDRPRPAEHRPRVAERAGGRRRRRRPVHALPPEPRAAGGVVLDARLRPPQRADRRLVGAAYSIPSQRSNSVPSDCWRRPRDHSTRSAPTARVGFGAAPICASNRGSRSARSIPRSSRCAGRSRFIRSSSASGFRARPTVVDCRAACVSSPGRSSSPTCPSDYR